MDGQLGGGVVVAVAALLWLVYLLPTWQSRMQYNAAERNAVRLNQALRVLAETSETPDEVRVELTAREAAAKQKLARRLQAERTRLRLEQSRLQADKDLLALEVQRMELARQRSAPAVRQARARRRVRVGAALLAVAGLVASAVGVWAVVTGLGPLWPVPGAGAAVLGLLTLQRMAAVQARAARSIEKAAAPARPAMPAVLLDEKDRGWVPRPLPAPLSTTTGSRAQAARAELEARQARRRAAHEETLRLRADELRPAPVPIEAARATAAVSPYARMGYVDDAEIEAHVRELLARRASA